MKNIKRNGPCSVDNCGAAIKARGLCERHYKIRRRYGDENYPAKQRASPGYGTTNALGYRQVTSIDGRVFEHIAVAERALGRKLPAGAVVHHVNGNRADNSPRNLVICPNQAYHFLLHQRQRAFDATGNPNQRRCYVCKEWDAPEALTFKSHNQYHPACARASLDNR